MQTGATAFLYAYLRSGSVDDRAPWFRLWLVACAHVIEDTKRSGARDLLVRMNKSVASVPSSRASTSSRTRPAAARMKATRCWRWTTSAAMTA